MLSNESIVVITIVIITMCALSYYCYTKLTTHEQYIGNIHQRCQNLEIMLTQPSPSTEIESVFEPPSKDKEKICKDGMCYLKPIDEDEDEPIIQEEINRIISEAPNKKKPILPPPPKSTIEDVK